MISLPRRALASATLSLIALAASPFGPSAVMSSMALGQSAPREAAARRTPTGSVKGRVTVGADGVAGVAIELLSSRTAYAGQRAAAVARATTDEDGRYHLLNVPAGRYTVRAIAPTYVILGDNPYRAMARTVVVDEGDAIDDVNFSMMRGAVITGRVTDGEGRPVIGEVVRLEQLEEQGQSPLMYSFSRERFTTDDRGIYRIYGLPAGRYRVSIGMGKDDNEGRINSRGRRPYQRTFHPATTEQSEAKIVEVSAGAEATGINISVGSLSEAFKAEGRIVDAESGQPIPGLRVSYGNVDRERRYISTFGPGDHADQKGEFHIENLTPGHYAAFLVPEGETQWYSEPAPFEVVDGDVSGLEIKARRGATLSGVIVIEGADARSVRDKLRRARIFVNVERQGLHPPMRSNPVISADGSFTFTGLPPGKAQIGLYPSDSSDIMTLVRVEREGVVQNNGIELVAGEQVSGVRLLLAYGTGVLRGRVVTASGAPPEGMMMSVTMRRADTEGPQRGFGPPPVEVDERGRFLVEGIASGDYEVTLHVFPQAAPGSEMPSPPRRPRRPIVQKVSVTSGAQAEITFTLDADADDAGDQR